MFSEISRSKRTNSLKVEGALAATQLRIRDRPAIRARQYPPLAKSKIMRGERYLAAMDSADRTTPEVVEAKAERLKEKIEIRSLQVHVPPSLTATCRPLPVSVKVRRTIYIGSFSASRHRQLWVQAV